ncbi:MAG: hypothetical protein K0U93_26580, partial [Gammaproteobacteria bacterium]|nr:hypothetical protein [Gammaproteobacteria bacterium]
EHRGTHGFGNRPTNNHPALSRHPDGALTHPLSAGLDVPSNLREALGCTARGGCLLAVSDRNDEPEEYSSIVRVVG